MKLKNKISGEIKEFALFDGNELQGGATLESLMKEWEDYKEPFSTSFYTLVDGEIKHCIFYRERVAGCPSDAWAYLKDNGRECIKKLKEVGLYFETKEEAELAVRKLKAWKRLKDNGFKIKGWKFTPNMKQIEGNYVKIEAEIPQIIINEKDIDLLFGGEG